MNENKKPDETSIEDEHSYDFLGFHLHAKSTLKKMTKDELISYIYMVYHNWSRTDVITNRVTRAASELYLKFKDNNKQLLIYKLALELYVEWTTECGFGYKHIEDKYEKYKEEVELMGITSSLIYIAIQEAKKMLEKEKNGKVKEDEQEFM